MKLVVRMDDDWPWWTFGFRVRDKQTEKWEEASIKLNVRDRGCDTLFFQKELAGLLKLGEAPAVVSQRKHHLKSVDADTPWPAEHPAAAKSRKSTPPLLLMA